jgi:curved DNA-binding protein CbpA
VTDRPFDPYAMLQVARHAEPDVIQAAYRALARRIHPDHSDDPAAQVRMAELNRAWEVLGDPIRRAAYDREQAAAGGSGASATGTRAWTQRADPGTPATERGPAGQPTGRGGTPAWRVGPDGEGGAGPPPGNPWGTVLDFGRHIGWSMGEIARVDPGYLEWLERQPAGRRYREEIDRTLRRSGRRTDDGPQKGPTRRGR